MIPSRPLDLGGIIGESIRIIKRIYWRSSLLFLAFCLPGFIVMQLGLNESLDAVQEMVEKFSHASGDAPILLRDYIFTEEAIPTSSFYYFRFQYPDLFSALDSVKYSIKAKYPDTTSRQIIKSRLDSIAAIVRISAPIKNDDLDVGILITLLGIVICAVGVIANVAAQYDLSSRAFEDRALNFAPILRLALRRNVWLIFVQYLLISVAIIFGMGIVIGIAYAISPILGVLGMLTCFTAIIYALLGILFSRVALVSEELGPIDAIKRSLELTKGMFLRILGIGLIGWLLIITLNTFMRLPFSYAIAPNIDWLTQYIRGNMISVANTFYDIRIMLYRWMGLSLISALLSAPFVPAFLTTFYYDLRTRREGALEYSSEPEIDN